MVYCFHISGLFWHCMDIPWIQQIARECSGDGASSAALEKRGGKRAIPYAAFHCSKRSCLTGFFFFFCFLQALLIFGLNRTSAISDASGRQQKKAIRTSVISLLLFTLQHGPLLLVHILTILPVSIKVNVGVIVTIWTLVFVPLGNVLLYVCFSIDFQRLFSKICYHFLRDNG